MRRYSPAGDDTTLLALHSLKWPDQKIADEMGFDKTTIRTHRARLGLDAHIRPPLVPALREMDVPPPKVKPNPVDAAKLILGARLEERRGGFFLDRVPVNLQTLMREANRIRAARGMNQLGPGHWHV